MVNEWLKATTAGSLERIRALLEEGIEINSKDKYGQTALMNASRNGRVEVVRLLIEKGADLDVTAKYNLSAREAGRVLIVEPLQAAGAEE